MDMKEAMHLKQELDSLGQSENANKLSIWFCLIVSVAAWVFLSYWSVSLVAYGIESAHLYPPSFGKDEIMAFAIALQAINSTFGLTFPLLIRRWRFVIALPLVLSVYLAITAFEGYHGVLAQHKSSSAPALLAQEQAELDSLSRRITETSTQLSNVYSAKRDAFNTIADDAAKGRDETGIAVCNKICKDNRRRYATATTRYSHLALQAAPAAATLPPDADLRLLLTDVKGRSDKLNNAKQDLITFYRELDKSDPPALLISEIDGIAKAIQDKVTAYQNLHSLSTFTLALEQTNQAVADVVAARLPEPESRLPLVYGLLPSLAILVLGIMINACLKALGPGRQGIGHTVLEWFSESIQARILPRLNALSAKNFMMWTLIRTRAKHGNGEWE